MSTSVNGVAAPAPAVASPWLRLVLVGLGISVVPLDTAVNIAFPDITGSFGPPIGGALVAHWGWPGVFWFRAPIALTSLLFLRGLPRGAAAGRDQRFDILGAVLLAFGLAGLLLALNALPRLRDGD